MEVGYASGNGFVFRDPAQFSATLDSHSVVLRWSPSLGAFPHARNLLGTERVNRATGHGCWPDLLSRCPTTLVLFGASDQV